MLGIRNMTRPNPSALPRTGRVHFIGMSGRATAGLAVALKRNGWHVTGSDQRAYGVARNLLEREGIECWEPFDAAHLPTDADLVIAGGSLQTDNPELVAARESGLPCLTFPEFLAAWIPSEVFNLQVLGTNGKTTTTALVLQLLHAVGRDPGFLIGGLHSPLGETLRLPAIEGSEPLMITEADESRCARWLPRPKFDILPADAAVLTSLAPDHPETFDSDEAYFESFRARLRSLPASGFIVAHQADLERLQPGPLDARIIAIGDGHVLETGDGSGTFLLDGRRWSVGLTGHRQVANAALALLATEALGVELASPGLEASLTGFRGVKGRSELLSDTPVTVINDEAYHPEAIAATLEAARLRYPDRRWHVIFRPRYLWKPGSSIERGLPDALARAHVVHLFPEEIPGDRPAPAPGQERARQLHHDLTNRGVTARFHTSVDQMDAGVEELLRPGDAILFCCSASNYPLRNHLLKKLEQITGNSRFLPDAEEGSTVQEP